MKGAIGNTMVMNIVITFIILTTAFLVGSISYSKAFKVKTKVIDIIEKYNGNFSVLSSTTTGNKNKIMAEIESMLGDIGYRTSATGSSCNKGSVAESSNYDICIYKGENTSNSTYRGEYYKVVVYMYFDFPIIGDMVKFPVTGETRTFFVEIDN